MLVARTIANAVDQVSEMPGIGGAAAKNTQTGVLKKEWKATVDVEQVPLVASYLRECS